ncbi:MAG: hypothetical protein HYX66_09455 [Ignavibacteria bacterium]|nr:hypothetical protein [Ignavibacteria bacterium]
MLNRIFGIVVCAVYITSWFVPVARYGDTLSSGTVPGWQALRVSLSPLWSQDFPVPSAWYKSALMVFSGLSNLLIVIVMGLLLFDFKFKSKWLKSAVIVSAVVNLHWVLMSGTSVDALIGYYLWELTFIAVAVWLLLGKKESHRTV